MGGSNKADNCRATTVSQTTAEAALTSQTIAGAAVSTQATAWAALASQTIGYTTAHLELDDSQMTKYENF